MPRLIGCARCRRDFTRDNPRYRPRGRYCESCAITLGDEYEWCHHCRRAVAKSDYDYTISRCVDCRRAKSRADYWRDPEHARARHRGSYPRRRETIRRWLAANRDRQRAWWHAYQARRMLRILRGE